MLAVNYPRILHAEHVRAEECFLVLCVLVWFLYLLCVQTANITSLRHRILNKKKRSVMRCLLGGTCANSKVIPQQPHALCACLSVLFLAAVYFVRMHIRTKFARMYIFNVVSPVVRRAGSNYRTKSFRISCIIDCSCTVDLRRTETPPR